MKKRTWARHHRMALFLLAGLLPALAAGCAADPIDDTVPLTGLEGTDPFPPFELKTVEGEVRTLDDFLNRATLVNFFFPT